MLGLRRAVIRRNRLSNRRQTWMCIDPVAMNTPSITRWTR